MKASSSHVGNFYDEDFLCRQRDFQVSSGRWLDFIPAARSSYPPQLCMIKNIFHLDVVEVDSKKGGLQFFKSRKVNEKYHDGNDIETP